MLILMMLLISVPLGQTLEALLDYQQLSVVLWMDDILQKIQFRVADLYNFVQNT